MDSGREKVRDNMGDGEDMGKRIKEDPAVVAHN